MAQLCQSLPLVLCIVLLGHAWAGSCKSEAADEAAVNFKALKAWTEAKIGYSVPEKVLPHKLCCILLPMTDSRHTIDCCNFSCHGRT
jgi:hypothetical protein